MGATQNIDASCKVYVIHLYTLSPMKMDNSLKNDILSVAYVQVYFVTILVLHLSCSYVHMYIVYKFVKCEFLMRKTT